MQLLNVMAFVAFVASSATAVSVSSRSSQDVFVPQITSPVAGDIWPVGTTQNVTWNTSNAPSQITNDRGQIMLAQNGYATPLVLATDFNILQGWATVITPDVINGTHYQIQLFGDSGNLSDNFVITGSDSFF